MLTTFDELPHPVGPDELWRESWYMNFFDHEQELYGVAWMGVRPNVGHGEVLFAVGQREQFLIRFEDFHIPIGRDIGRERTKVGPLSFTVIEPYRRWRLEYVKGKDRIELEWEAVSPVYNWEYQEGARSWHYQHPGRIHGRMSIGGKNFTFNGFGERDRAWGKRDNSFFEAVHWQTAQFPHGLYYHGMLLEGPGPTELYGCVQSDGQTSLLSKIDMEVDYAYVGGPPIAVHTLMVDRLGREFAIKQELLNVVAMGSAEGANEMRLYFTFNRFRYGDKIGYGMMDHWWSRFDRLGRAYHGEESNWGRLFPLEEYD